MEPKFDSGFKRTELKPRWDLLFQMPKALLRLIKVREYALTKYGENNWQLGKDDPIAQQDIYNHLMQHLFDYKAGKTDKDHLAHAFCNIAFLLEYGCGEDWDKIEFIDGNSVPGSNTLKTMFTPENLKMFKNMMDKCRAVPDYQDDRADARRLYECGVSSSYYEKASLPGRFRKGVYEELVKLEYDQMEAQRKADNDSTQKLP